MENGKQGRAITALADYIIPTLPLFQSGLSRSHGEEAGVVRYSHINSIFFLYCISNTDSASGIFADSNLQHISGFPMNRCLTVISYGLWTLISSTSLRSKRWSSWKLLSWTSSEDTCTSKHPGFKSESPLLLTTAGILVITLFLPDPLLGAAEAVAATLAASSVFASC